jgi:hypothetical protein
VRTHDRSLELSYDADDIGRVGGVSSDSLNFKVRAGDGSTKDRSDEGESE